MGFSFFRILLVCIGCQLSSANQTARPELEERLGIVSHTEKVDVLVQLADLLRETEPEQSLTLGKQALVLADELEYSAGVAAACGGLSATYEGLGEFDAALAYLKRREAVQRALLEIERRDRAAELDLIRESQEVENRIALLQRDMRIRELTLKRKLTIQNALLALLIPLLILLLVLNRFNRLKTQRTLELKQRESEIRKKTYEIQQTESELKQKAGELDTAQRKLQDLLMTDSLTGLPNRRYIWDKMVYEKRRSIRTRRPFALVYGDIDDFAKINAKYGKDCGDFILKSLSRLMSSLAREQDTVSRWGGEEFLVLLPETHLPGGLKMAERVRLDIDYRNFQYMNQILPVTMTFGVSVYYAGEELKGMIARAEDAMLAGKKAGKNCVMPKAVK